MCTFHNRDSYESSLTLPRSLLPQWIFLAEATNFFRPLRFNDYLPPELTDFPSHFYGYDKEACFENIFLSSLFLLLIHYNLRLLFVCDAKFTTSIGSLRKFATIVYIDSFQQLTPNNLYLVVYFNDSCIIWLAELWTATLPDTVLLWKARLLMMKCRYPGTQAYDSWIPENAGGRPNPMTQTLPRVLFSEGQCGLTHECGWPTRMVEAWLTDGLLYSRETDRWRER